MTALFRRLARWYAPGWLVLLALGCAGSLEAARSEPNLKASQATAERCESLDDAQAWAALTGETFGFLAGGAGLATIVVDDPDTQMGLAIGAAASGAIAAGAAAYASNRSTAWARECSSR